MAEFAGGSRVQKQVLSHFDDFSERPLLTSVALDDQIDHDDDVMNLIIIVMMRIIIHIEIVCGLRSRF